MIFNEKSISFETLNEYISNAKINKRKFYIIYAHINTVNNKIYIGQTSVDPLLRWRNGEGYLGKNNKGNYRQPKFAMAIKKYGWENFDHRILFFTDNPLLADEKEVYFIKKYNLIEDGYNLSIGRSCTS